MKKQRIDETARIAEKQRIADGLPTFNFRKLYAAMPQDQKKRLWDYVNQGRKDGNQMCMKSTTKE